MYSELTAYVQIINDLLDKSKSTGNCDLNDNKVNGSVRFSQHLLSLQAVIPLLWIMKGVPRLSD